MGFSPTLSCYCREFSLSLTAMPIAPLSVLKGGKLSRCIANFVLNLTAALWGGTVGGQPKANFPVLNVV